jgi:hypothetical protein
LNFFFLTADPARRGTGDQTDRNFCSADPAQRGTEQKMSLLQAFFAPARRGTEESLCEAERYILVVFVKN